MTTTETWSLGFLLKDEDVDTVWNEPKPMTNCCAMFIKERYQVLNFFKFITSVSSALDDHNKQRIALLKKVFEKNKSEEMSKAFEELLKNSFSMESLRKFDPYISENILIRTVNNFLWYLTNMLLLVFKNKPETMKSDEKLPYNEILDYSSMEDLHAYIAEKKVLGTAYKKFEDLNKYFIKNFNIPIAEENDIEKIVKVIEVRNLLVHNKNIINNIFLTRIKEEDLSWKGKKVIVNIDDAIGSLYFFSRLVFAMDSQMAQKYSIPQNIQDEEQAIETTFDSIFQ